VYCQSNDVHKSSSLEVYYQCSVEETHNNMLLELFCQIISEPCFDILRTQEQLGSIAGVVSVHKTFVNAFSTTCIICWRHDILANIVGCINKVALHRPG